MREPEYSIEQAYKHHEEMLLMVMSWNGWEYDGGGCFTKKQCVCGEMRNIMTDGCEDEYAIAACMKWLRWAGSAITNDGDSAKIDVVSSVFGDILYEEGATLELLLRSAQKIADCMK